MKKLFLPIVAFLMFTGFACGSSKSADAEMIDTLGKTIDAPSSGNPDLLIGKWRVDSAGFIDNNVRKPLEVPLANTIWEFTSDEKLSINGSISVTSDCHVVDNAFTINMMGVDATYRITKLTKDELELMSTIVDTKDLKMESISKFSKVK